MKKIFKYLAMAVLGMAFALPAAHSAEAAKLAVIPLIMNSGVLWTRLALQKIRLIKVVLVLN